MMNAKLLTMLAPAAVLGVIIYVYSQHDVSATQQLMHEQHVLDQMSMSAQMRSDLRHEPIPQAVLTQIAAQQELVDKLKEQAAAARDEAHDQLSALGKWLQSAFQENAGDGK